MAEDMEVDITFSDVMDVDETMTEEDINRLLNTTETIDNGNQLISLKRQSLAALQKHKIQQVDDEVSINTTVLRICEPSPNTTFDKFVTPDTSLNDNEPPQQELIAASDKNVNVLNATFEKNNALNETFDANTNKNGSQQENPTSEKKELSAIIENPLEESLQKKDLNLNCSEKKEIVNLNSTFEVNDNVVTREVNLNCTFDKREALNSTFDKGGICLNSTFDKNAISMNSTLNKEITNLNSTFDKGTNNLNSTFEKATNLNSTFEIEATNLNSTSEKKDVNPNINSTSERNTTFETSKDSVMSYNENETTIIELNNSTQNKDIVNSSLQNDTNQIKETLEVDLKNEELQNSSIKEENINCTITNVNNLKEEEVMQLDNLPKQSEVEICKNEECLLGPVKTCKLLNISKDEINSEVVQQQEESEVVQQQEEEEENEAEDIFEDARPPEEEIEQLLDGRRISLSRYAVEIKLDEQDPKILLTEGDDKLDESISLDSTPNKEISDDVNAGCSVEVNNKQISPGKIINTEKLEENTLKDESLQITNEAISSKLNKLRSSLEATSSTLNKVEHSLQPLIPTEKNISTEAQVKENKNEERDKVQFTMEENTTTELQQEPRNENRNLMDFSLLEQPEVYSPFPPREKVLSSVNRMHEPENDGKVNKESIAPLLKSELMDNHVSENKENIKLLPGRLEQLQRSERQEKPRTSLLRLFDPLSNTEEEKVKEITIEKPIEIPQPQIVKSENLPSTGKLIDLDLTITEAMDAENEEKMNLKQEINRLKLELIQAKQENTTIMLEFQKKDEVSIKAEAEWQEKFSQLQTENKQLLDKLENVNEQNNNEEQLHHLKKDLKDCQQEVKRLTEENAHYQKIMNEYESTLSAKNCENEKLKMEHSTVTKHLAALEAAFSDVITKYERCKEIISGYSRNEETLNKRLEKSNQIAIKYEERYETLKSHANSQLDKANKDLVQTRENHKLEIGKLATLTKRLEIKISSLQQTLDQKTAECAALATLCDEMTGTSPVQ